MGPGDGTQRFDGRGEGELHGYCKQRVSGSSDLRGRVELMRVYLLARMVESRAVRGRMSGIDARTRRRLDGVRCVARVVVTFG